MAEAQFDIVILAHGHLELTMRCVKTLYERTVIPFHLIVSDDSTPDMDDGTDLTPEWITKFCKVHDNITYVHSDTLYKNSKEQFTEIFKHCVTPYLAVVVNSLIVEPEWEIAALQVMKTNPQIGILGLKCIRYGTELIESAGLAMLVGGGSYCDIGAGQPGHRFSKAYECDVVQWAFVLLRKEAVEPNLGEAVYNGYKGCEEFETCLTVREAGWKIFYCGLGVGYHQYLATRRAKNENDIMQNLQNKEIFAKRWGYWEVYHRYNTGATEFFPDMEVRKEPFPPIMLIDPSGMISKNVERTYQRTDEK